jgi:hypothetical protein
MNLPETHPNDSLLNEYLDGMLLPGEITALESHLEQCSACAQRLADLRQVFTRLSSLPEAPLARDLSVRVTQTLKEQRLRQQPGVTVSPQFSPPPLRLPQLVTALQAFTALLLLAVYWRSFAQTLAIAPPDLTAIWQVLVQPIFSFLQLIGTQFAQVANRLPHWNNTAFPLLETLVLLAIFWLVGNGYLIFETRHPRRKQ